MGEEWPSQFNSREPSRCPSPSTRMRENAYAFDSGTKEFGSRIPDDATISDGDFGISRCPSPWLERWYDEGSTTSFQEFSARMALCLLTSPGKCDGQDRHTGETSQAKSGKTGTPGQPASSSPLNSLGKRPHEPKRHGASGEEGTGGFDDGDDNDDGPSHPQRRRLAGPSEGASAPGKFACPYQKRHPSQNSLCGLPHGKRTHYGWGTVSRVKYAVGMDHWWRERRC